jgi:hypothetical protein
VALGDGEHAGHARPHTVDAVFGIVVRLLDELAFERLHRLAVDVGSQLSQRPEDSRAAAVEPAGRAFVLTHRVLRIERPAPVAAVELVLCARHDARDRVPRGRLGERLARQRLVPRRGEEHSRKPYRLRR